jgi:hypothetical protein
MSEQTYKINVAIKVVFQAMGGQTGLADLSMVVYDPSDNASSPVILTEVGNGIYESSFTPDEIGRWWVKITSSACPENGVKESYYVGETESIGVVLRDAEGHDIDITPDGRLKVSQEVSNPPGTTPIYRQADGSVAGTVDTFYTITNSKTLHLQKFLGGCEFNSGGGGKIQLWYDPNGNTVNMVLISVGYACGGSFTFDQNQEYLGNGTKRILLRAIRTGIVGLRDMFRKWEGYEV